MYPSKNDIVEVIESLKIALDAHALIGCMLNSKRLGGMLERALIEKNISFDDFSKYHKEINTLIESYIIGYSGWRK